jgi:hypothetical protein
VDASVTQVDQDQAERFDTEVLGLQVKTSAPYRPVERWLSVVASEEPDGVELVLHLADAGAGVPGGQPPGRPAQGDRTASSLPTRTRLPTTRRFRKCKDAYS